MTFAIKIEVKETDLRAVFSIVKISFGDRFCYLRYIIFISSSDGKTNPVAIQKEKPGFVAQQYHNSNPPGDLRKKVIQVALDDLQGKDNDIMLLSAVPLWEIDALS